MELYFNIYNHITPYDETEIAADYIYHNAEVRCTKLEALKYIIAEHEYLGNVGFNIYANYATYSDKFNYNDMLNYISDNANLSKRKTELFRKTEDMYLRLRSNCKRNNEEDYY